MVGVTVREVAEVGGGLELKDVLCEGGGEAHSRSGHSENGATAKALKSASTGSAGNVHSTKQVPFAFTFPTGEISVLCTGGSAFDGTYFARM